MKLLMKFTKIQHSNIFCYSMEFNSQSRTKIINMKEEFLRMHIDLSRGMKLMKTNSYLYCINQ